MADSIFPHVPTLGLATFCVACLLCVLLTCTWLQNRSQRAVLYWAAVYVLMAVGMVMLAKRGVIPDFLSISVANGLVILAAGLNWAGARAFEGRATSVWWYAPPAVAWVVVSQLQPLAGNINLRVIVVSVTLSAFLYLAAYEFWRGRGELLVSRWLAVIILGIYGSLMLLRVPIALALPLPDSPALFASGVFGLVALSTLLFINALAFVLLALTKERTELLHKQAAYIDPLTDLLNRRAFFASGEACFARQGRRQRPLAALVFDLDRFKQVNDRFGHAVGDRVLEHFSEAVRRELRATDIVGRLGGEEFAALLPDCSQEQALEAAERVRRAFAAAAADAMSDGGGATVSVGVAMRGSDGTLAALLARADDAVYRAKGDGRNCIRVAQAAVTAPSLVPAAMPNGRAAA